MITKNVLNQSQITKKKKKRGGETEDEHRRARMRRRDGGMSETRMKRSVRDGEKGRKLTGGVYRCLWVQ